MPARFVPIVFGLVLSSVMSFVVSGIAVFRNGGFADSFVSLWLGGWLPSWAIAFPVVLVVAPIARRLVNSLVRP